MKRLLIILAVALFMGATFIGLTMLSLNWMHDETILETKSSSIKKEDEDAVETKRLLDQKADFEHDYEIYPTIGGFVGVGIGTLLGVWLAGRLRERSRQRQVQSVHPKWLMPNAPTLPAKSVESQVIQTKVRR